MSPIFGVAALGQGEANTLTEKNERRLFGRRRRANVDGGREKSYRVYVTAEEDAQLRARAVVADVTVPRLLFESAMNANIETTTDRKSAIAELFVVTRLMANVSNNVNQLAKFANTEGQFPGAAAAVVAEYRALAVKVEDVIDRLADS
ncbi:plasmid mobilization relaxosome protein MobC [Cryobacterium melibiosiphilum]|uniref:Plasmid mobilization relaxosome protein MobC n=1 Tax=Cryobacterium melibiosiphilum TaxID=995039 RepID=A0A3A5MIP5_9MICO|nr:plasmid mobilization relaxosome protein MobC [Cryobacterium melibiosiphilum]RJT90040.1 plasmid mobilization relaxosome protein MobC [Cryobacterium melibiosiphilum]